jgi:hypothetical protein
MLRPRTTRRQTLWIRSRGASSIRSAGEIRGGPGVCAGCFSPCPGGVAAAATQFKGLQWLILLCFSYRASSSWSYRCSTIPIRGYRHVPASAVAWPMGCSHGGSWGCASQQAWARESWWACRMICCMRQSCLPAGGFCRWRWRRGVRAAAIRSRRRGAGGRDSRVMAGARCAGGHGAASGPDSI